MSRERTEEKKMLMVMSERELQAFVARIAVFVGCGQLRNVLRKYIPR